MADDNFIRHDYQGKIIPLRPTDGFVNATAIAAVGEKDLTQWFRTKDTLELFCALAEDLGIEFNSVELQDLDTARLSASKYGKIFPGLAFSKRGAPDTGGGVWLHPDLAIQLAQWCSKPFAIKVSRWVREWMMTGQNPVAPTAEQIVAMLTRSDAAIWKERFESEFYEHLSRLTGLEQIGHKRPKYWAALTNEFVYDLLPEGVATALRKCRTENGGWDKLHQYLSPNGLAVFQDHMKTLIRDMEGADSINQLRRVWGNRSKFLYRRDLVQLALFTDNRKDGKLLPSPDLNTEESA